MRRVLLWMAGNRWLRRHLPRLWFARRAVRRFMPGETMAEALSAAETFAARGVGVLFTHLGENLTRIDEADRTADHYAALIDEAAVRGLNAEVSLKLTQLGLDFDPARAAEHLVRLVERASGPQERTVWIDMEGSAYTEATVALYERLKVSHPNLGICLQAYLKRTYVDVQRLLPLEPRIRLVKGAYAEPAEIAYRSRPEVDAHFLALAVSLLDARSAGRALFLGLGTHDTRLIEQVADHAERAGLLRTAFDVEMLYGIRSDQQQRLLAAGYNVRVLIAYGEAWYPWYMRRLAERPANVVFALRQLLP